MNQSQRSTHWSKNAANMQQKKLNNKKLPEKHFFSLERKLMLLRVSSQSVSIASFEKKREYVKEDENRLVASKVVSYEREREASG